MEIQFYTSTSKLKTFGTHLQRGAGYSHTRPPALQMRTHPALRAQLQNGKPKDNLQQYRTEQ